ncbi:MAG: hypothetical protein EPO07_10225, partial [Verrucomicrobia bacterium]
MPEWITEATLPVLPAENLAESAELEIPPASPASPETTPRTPAAQPPLQPIFKHGWPVPSSVSVSPDEARACIYLPEFYPDTLAVAQLIAGRYPFAEAEFRTGRAKLTATGENDVPHFERVFRIAARLANVRDVEISRDYDELLILTAWHCVKPGVSGYLGSYPKSLLCPLSHAAPPIALESLPPAKRIVFDRRAPIYLRYLLSEKFGLKTCADIENADLRHLLRGVGFRLIRSSAVPEVAFAGITRGDDPPVRPWKLTLRQELSDDRAAELLTKAALWQIEYGL